MARVFQGVFEVEFPIRDASLSIGELIDEAKQATYATVRAAGLIPEGGAAVEIRHAERLLRVRVKVLSRGCFVERRGIEVVG